MGQRVGRRITVEAAREIALEASRKTDRLMMEDREREVAGRQEAKTVYVVLRDVDEGCQAVFEGIFSTEAKAEAFIATQATRFELRIEEWELD